MNPIKEEQDRKRKALGGDDESRQHENSKEEDAQIVVLQSPAAAAMASQNSSNEDEDEVQLLYSTALAPHADFPHAREHCLVKPFKVAPAVHCPNCYCYVCDRPARDCDDWEKRHGHAVSLDPEWRRQRQERKQPKVLQMPLIRTYTTR
jgi:hypothetical protein